MRLRVYDFRGRFSCSCLHHLFYIDVIDHDQRHDIKQGHEGEQDPDYQDRCRDERNHLDLDGDILTFHGEP